MKRVDMETVAFKEVSDRATTIILDIEGTTTSISYVKEVLYPYAAIRLAQYVQTNWDSYEMKGVLNTLMNDQSHLESHEGFVHLPPVPSCDCEIEDYQNIIVSHLKWLYVNGILSLGLKMLQGYIWLKGYLDGSLKGHVYDDVPVALKYWKKQGKRIFTFSAGCVSAQIYLFTYSNSGDLDKFIDGNFDGTFGSKIECETYVKMAQKIKEKPENIVFFTDRPKEVYAAKKSNMHVVRMDREFDNIYLPEESEYLGAEDVTLISFEPLIDVDRPNYSNIIVKNRFLEN